MTKAPAKASTKKDAKYYETKAANMRAAEEHKKTIKTSQDALRKLRGK